MTCPHCGNADAARLGYEIRGVYDGVLYWVCGNCGRAWPRFTDGPLGELSEEYVDKHETFHLFAHYVEAVLDHHHAEVLA